VGTKSICAKSTIIYLNISKKDKIVCGRIEQVLARMKKEPWLGGTWICRITSKEEKDRKKEKAASSDRGRSDCNDSESEESYVGTD